MPRPGRHLLLLAIAVITPGVLAAPASDLWPFWNASDDTSARQVEHGAWQALLDRYLVLTDDDRTLFRYASVEAEDSAALQDYVSSLASIDPRGLARPEQMAYWINLYNALTVQVVLDHPRESSILDMGNGWFLRPGPWNDRLVTIAGKSVTLNDIEHRILRPIWKDHRIHYAVNCASIGCPNLAPQAYSRANLEQLLDAGEKSYLNHPRGLRFDDRGRLVLSSIFDWYIVDFGDSRASLLEYLASRRGDIAERLREHSGTVRNEYDWSLNAADSR